MFLPQHKRNSLTTITHNAENVPATAQEEFIEFRNNDAVRTEFYTFQLSNSGSWICSYNVFCLRLLELCSNLLVIKSK
ncbi:hypothetical protein I79_009634 [Cricetulus griseus]|uniref:Uncharacterized protein n=1 Tax=Cricetulus griseus TaxID=10029 RepID=G3HGB0_CRIGR|nr:hypothetical protein I79_009634 [Cricetulus griseus]